ncbi:MAG: hypothetical protein EXR72_21290 [Myxococcales bacterium]|nr:hypothetical protein [Myxococcales bacterium]
MGEIEAADRHQQDPGAQADRVVKEEIEERGLEADLSRAVLELDLRGEANEVGDGRRVEQVEAARLEGESVADPSSRRQLPTRSM